MNNALELMFEKSKSCPMIAVINGTNRPDNKSQYFSQLIVNYLETKAPQSVAYIDLANLPEVMNINKMYLNEGQSEYILELKEKILIPSTTWLLIVPEYNGSYPGILKMFFDALSIHKMKETFYHKKVGMIGISDGRAENLRGMEHLTGMFNYLKMTVYHNKLPISSVKSALDGTEILEPTASVLRNFVEEFLEWANMMSAPIRAADRQ